MEIQAETLALLEWERLGEQVAGFAGSCLGANLCRPLQLAPTLEEAQRRQTETAELLVLDGLTEGGLSFQGVSATAEAYCTREWAYCGGAMAVNRLGHVAIEVKGEVGAGGFVVRA